MAIVPQREGWGGQCKQSGTRKAGLGVMPTVGRAQSNVEDGVREIME